MSLTRRTFLGSTALLSFGLLAGCVGDGGSDDGTTTDGETTTDDGTTTDGETTTDEPTDTTDDLPDGNGTDDGTGGTRPSGGPGISLVGVDDAPDVPVEHDVEITEDLATDEHPPQVRITLTNTGDETVEVGEGRTVFFQYVSDTTNDLIFLPADGEYPAEAGCWRLEDHIAVTDEYRVLSLEPGESRSELVDLYGVAQSEKEEASCLPVGEFRFEADFATGGLSGSDDERQEATWGFSLALE
ncbi:MULTISPECIES: hypothetical protein [unclassified Haloferax]|uniref:hypothetical protein n=1 Tax=unclassified Haloferax TaxID=2625095 RepID=UPI002874E02C|nr:MULTISPECIES: hypothetical protein [unclassified Haloferax]MDS0242290.1 hypothetical protein [Haloferax sp. S2CR25]MDS0445411.1 hypothetical protein [Haloferax sp. S2CR25-2]